MKKKFFAIALSLAVACFVAASAFAGPVMDRILKNKKLLVGITGTQPPLNAINKTGKIIGLDADIANAISANLGVDLKLVKMPFAELLPALESGKVDMVISGMTMTLERNKKVAFVGPYYVSGKGILTKTGQISTLQDPESVNKPDFRIAALKDSTSESLVRKAYPKAKLVTTPSYDEAIDMLLTDEVDALIADYPYCGFSAFRYKDKGLIAGESKLTFEPLGIAVPEDALLINWLQNFTMALEGSGSLKLLNKKWFEDGSWIKELP
jgi:polar amino acid transport system substrate-binding protein